MMSEPHNPLPTPFSPSSIRQLAPSSPSLPYNTCNLPNNNDKPPSARVYDGPLAPPFEPSTPHSSPPRYLLQRDSSNTKPVLSDGRPHTPIQGDQDHSLTGNYERPLAQTHTPASSLGTPRMVRVNRFQRTNDSIQADDPDRSLSPPPRTRVSPPTHHHRSDFWTSPSIHMNAYSYQLLSQPDERTESSKPDYLRRVPRPVERSSALEDNPSPRKKVKREPPPSPPTQSRSPSTQLSVTSSSIGISVSPARGRVLTLFEDPMSTISAAPQRLISQETLKWLQESSSPPGTKRPMRPLSQDHASKNAQRLAAFKLSADVLSHAPVPDHVIPRLHAVEHPRQGRVLQPVEDALNSMTLDSGPPKWPDTCYPWCETTRERRRLQTIENEARLTLLTRFFERDSDSESGDGPQDPQGEQERSVKQSWSLVYDRQLSSSPSPSKSDRRGKAKTGSRASSTPGSRVSTPQPPAFRPGRGKMVPLPSHPQLRPSTPKRTKSRRKAATSSPSPPKNQPTRTLYFSTDPADALSALRSKRQARIVATESALRKASDKGTRSVSPRKRTISEDANSGRCICGSKNDDKPMVCCDRCKTWYHLVCMRIYDEDDLGDTWYCWKCSHSTRRSPALSSSLEGSRQPRPHSNSPPQPTFAPTVHTRPSTPNPPLYRSNGLEPSPMLESAFETPSGPSRSHVRNTFSSPRRLGSSRSWADNVDPVHGGPITPLRSTSHRGVDLSSPKFFDEDEQFSSSRTETASFDPTSTPSRGLRLESRTSNWSVRGGPVFSSSSAWGTPLFGTPGRTVRSDEYDNGSSPIHSSPLDRVHFSRSLAESESPVQSLPPSSPSPTPRRLGDRAPSSPPSPTLAYSMRTLEHPVV